MAASATGIESSQVASRKWQPWAGRVVSAVPVLMLALSATMKLSHAPAFVEKWTQGFGFTEASLTPIGILELACAVVYLVPRTAVLGAILVGCYLAGATCAHVRIGDGAGAVTPVVLGVLAWLGLWLREEKLRGLLPLRQG
jgi:Na+/proline symporter